MVKDNVVISGNQSQILNDRLPSFLYSRLDGGAGLTYLRVDRVHPDLSHLPLAW